MGADDEALTPEQQNRLRAAVRLRVRVLLGFALFYVATMVVAVVVLSRAHPERHPNPWVLWPLVIGPPLLALAVGGAVGFRWLRRPGPVRRLVVSGDRRDLRRVARDLRQGRVVAGKDREIAASIVATMRRQSRLSWLWLALGVATIALALAEHGGGRALRIGFGAAYLLLGGAYWWTTRRTVRRAAAQGITASGGGSSSASDDPGSS